MTNDIEWEILDRYFGGQCTPAEIQRIERWAEGDATRGQLLASARAVWESTGAVPKRFDVDAAWGAVQQRMAPAPAGPALVRAGSRADGSRDGGSPDSGGRDGGARWRFAPPTDRSFQYAVAALVMLAVGGGLAWKLGIARGFTSDSPKPEAARAYVTQRGQRADFHLRDGTRVRLGVASRLEVPATFGRKGRERDVVLEGEAYFEVRHDTASRFLVHTPDAVTEDVGTAFAIRAYRGDAGAQVAVAEGRVVVHPGGGLPNGRGTLLTRGQVGKIQPSGPVAVIDVADLAPYLGWTDGRLVFRDTPRARRASPAQPLVRYRVSIG